MDLLVVRHAIAEDRETFAKTEKDDRLRPLTPEGRKRMRRGARGLARCAPPVDRVATSRLVRAVETAEILAEILEAPAPEQVDALLPEAPPEALLDWLHKHEAETVALVGHEPQLGLFVGWLLSAEKRAAVELKKGAACLLRLEAGAGPGAAVLRWALTPSQLRRLGR